MFLNESEVKLILQQPLFSSPVTESDKSFIFYRGKRRAHLYTVRFNMIPSFSETFMSAFLQDKLTSPPFQLQSRLRASVHYDLLLCNRTAVPVTYYIWVSNTNCTSLTTDHQVDMMITYANIARFTEQVTNVNLADLDTNFISSDVTVDRVLAVVFTFEH